MLDVLEHTLLVYNTNLSFQEGILILKENGYEAPEHRDLDGEMKQVLGGV